VEWPDTDRIVFRMSHDPNPPSDQAPKLSPSDAKALARRRLLRAGLGSAPVLLVASPRSVMAGGGQCVTGSAFTSLNAVASHQPRTHFCQGKSPDFWKDDRVASLWPNQIVRSSTGNTVATTFEAIFGRGGGWYSGKTCLDILRLPANAGRDGVARHLMASVLNSLKGWTPNGVLSITTAKDVWSEYTRKGHYEPTAGIKWYEDSASRGNGGITPWLKSTMSG